MIKRARFFSKLHCLALLLSGLAIGQSLAAITVTDTADKSLTGEIVRATGTEILLQTTTQRVPIKLSQLAEASRAEALAYAKTKGVFVPFPPIKVQASVATAARPFGNSFYRKEMEMKPRAIIEGASRLEPMPEGDATMMVITMDTRAKYAGGRESYSVHSTETLNVPAVPTGERRQFDFAPSSVIYDAYRDKSNVGGFVYKYFIFGLRDKESKILVDFQTNHPQLATLCKANPAKREEFLGLGEGKPFPTDVK